MNRGFFGLNPVGEASVRQLTLKYDGVAVEQMFFGPLNGLAHRYFVVVWSILRGLFEKTLQHVPPSRVNCDSNKVRN